MEPKGCQTIVLANIEQLTKENEYFRKVISTSPTMQVVLMALRPLEEIGLEAHQGITQFFRVESGVGLAQIETKGYIEDYKISDGSFVFILPDTKHNIINTSNSRWLKLYTIYSPPNHPCNRVDKVKE